MTALFQKLNLKAQNPILISSSPTSFKGELDSVGMTTPVHTTAVSDEKYKFTLTFVVSQTELIAQAPILLKQTTPDAILWFAYPKQTSKAYESDLNRDICREMLETFGLESNRQVAIDDDWSALRFKKV